eukprot:PhF_6_TR30686/c0_g1_i2/m.45149
MYTLHTVYFGSAFSFTLFLVFFRWTLWDDFQYHPILASVALYTLVPATVHFHSRIRQQGYTTRATNLKTHSLLAYGLLATIILSLLAVFVHKVSKNKHHLTSWHSWCGMGLLVVFVAQLICGAAIYYNFDIPGVSRRGLYTSHKRLFQVCLVFWTLTIVIVVMNSHFVSSKVPSVAGRISICVGHFVVVGLLYYSKVMAAMTPIANGAVTTRNGQNNNINTN